MIGVSKGEDLDLNFIFGQYRLSLLHTGRGAFVS